VILAALAVSAVSGAAAPATADPGHDKRRVDQQLARTRAAIEVASQRVERAVTAYTVATRRLPDARATLARAQGVVAGARAAARSAARSARRANATRDTARASLAQAWTAVTGARERVGEYASDAYKGHDVARMTALLNAPSPADFVLALSYLDRIAAGQKSALDDAVASRLVAKWRENAAAVAEEAAVEALREANHAVGRAQTAAARAKQAERRVAALAGQRKRALKVARHERRATMARYALLRAESRRIAEQIRMMAAGGGFPAVVGIGPSRLPMPVHGWKSSDFGMRFDPFYHMWQLHAGVDLAANSGAPIRAAASGRVFRAGWNGGYGNYTCIYHGLYQGKGLATCYAHQSAIFVRVGRWVSRGDVIGRVGTTGASTGNHLHFEVRLNGNPINPLPWLPGCLC
jgi:murein DD-endopeptidase MepM/ murein hydrolase activator NlpD